MSGVFLSYDRDDSERARHFARVIEAAGHTVWWDLHVRGGAQFSKVIEEALKAADAVVVLWSKNSVESAWVRDEAAAGRDSGRLIPVTIDGTEPPLGFRQFQTIDLSTWKGRGRPVAIKTLLGDIDSLGAGGEGEAVAAVESPGMPADKSRNASRMLIAAAAVALVMIAAFAAWQRFGASGLPTVEVVAADGSPQSKAVANDLFVKLGSLFQIGNGKWQLVDASSGYRNADFTFRTADTSAGGKLQANLVLLDGTDNGVLWSRDFTISDNTESDVRQQLSLTAGRVIACALESRDSGGLKRDLLKLFLNSCASLADLQAEDYGLVAQQLRVIVTRDPKFKPAWSRLILADGQLLDLARYSASEGSLAQQFNADLARAKALFPDLPEIAIAKVRNMAPGDFAGRLRVLDDAAQRAPGNVPVAIALGSALMDVGRLNDAIAAAHRAADLDPLSPSSASNYVMALAYGGKLDSAREEFAKAEKLWAGTGALRDARTAFSTRFGDPAEALKLDPEGYNTATYLAARANPSAANIARFKAGVDKFRSKSVDADQIGWAIQGLGEFGLVDDVFYWLGRLPDEGAARISYILFRPALASARQDPRFMPLASRIGLIKYWRSSGHWPDFCDRPGISYDCKAEAAKLG